MFGFYKAVLDEKNVFFEPDSLDEFADVSNGNYSLASRMNVFEKHADDYYEGDFTWLDNSTVLMAKKTLKDIISLNSLILTGVSGSATYDLVEVDMIDCLDFSKSKISYFEGGKIIKSIDRFVFKDPSVLSEQLIFKVLGYDYSPIIYTERFVKIYESNKLTGLKFKKIK